MAFIDQGEFEAMKTLSGCRASRCDKHQFRAKMTVITQTCWEISLLNIVVLTRKKERKKDRNKEIKKEEYKNGTFATAHLHLAVFRIAFGHLYESC